MIKKCALCNEDKKLMGSHIIPKFISEYIKKTSPLGGIRNATTPNKREEDGKKLKLLCKDCEGRFSKYEDDFSQNIFSKITMNKMYRKTINEKTIYFCMSIIWRGLIAAKQIPIIKRINGKLVEAKEGYNELFQEEKEEIDILIEELKKFLLGEIKFSELKKYKFHLIPITEKMERKLNMEKYTFINRRLIDFGQFSAFSKKKEDFDYLAHYIKCPYFLLITEIIPNTGYKIKGGELIKDKKIDENKIELNTMAKRYLVSLEEARIKSEESLSQVQKDKIAERALEEYEKDPEAFVNSPAFQALLGGIKI